MKQIGIFGDTDYTRSAEFNSFLDYFLEKYNDKYIIVTGTSNGVESLAVTYADTNGVRCHIVSGTGITELNRRKKFGKLIDEAIVFWDGVNMETDAFRQDLFHMGIPVEVVLYNESGGTSGAVGYNS